MNTTNHAEPDGLRERIDQRIEQLRSEIASKVDEVKGLSRFLGDQSGTEDQVFDDAIADVDSAEIQRDLTELRQARSALSKLNAGTYGYCDQCSEPIPAARLLAQPLAANCIECQSSVEADQ
ncbi:MAG: TraR/DksA family transcriptional regulator [Burkholderiaceae bacterium]